MNGFNPEADFEKVEGHHEAARPTTSEDEQTSSSAVMRPPSLPYTVLAYHRRIIILFVVAFAASFSPLSSFIYYPAIKVLSHDLSTSVSKINLTITSYMIVSGIVPTMWGDLADQIGRRPVYFAMFTLYISSNIGLALQKSFAALIVLRMLQSAGGSATVGISYGIIGDIVAPSDRGKWMSLAACGPNVSPALGPVIGGILAQEASWPWIFWFLAILSGICLALLMSLLPETCRALVGNGAEPKRSIRALFHSKAHPESRNQKIQIPNPFLSVKILAQKDSTPIMLIYGIFYTSYCCLQASLSALFIDVYEFKELSAGLIYLPFGFGCLISAMFGGVLLNHDYRVTAKSHGTTIDRVRGDDLAHFPIEKARLRSLPLAVTSTTILMIPFGWVIQHRFVYRDSPLVRKLLTLFNRLALFDTARHPVLARPHNDFCL